MGEEASSGRHDPLKSGLNGTPAGRLPADLSSDLPAEAAWALAGWSEDRQAGRDSFLWHIRHLTSSDPSIREEAVRHLVRGGLHAAEELLRALQKERFSAARPDQYVEILGSLGRSASEPLERALHQAACPQSTTEAIILETLGETAIRLWGTRSGERITGLFSRLREALEHNDDTTLVAACQGARVRLHHLLSLTNNRAGVEDLLDLLGDGYKRIAALALEAIARVGDRRALGPLLELYPREAAVSEWGAKLIRLAIREILRREKLAPEALQGAALRPSQAKALELLVPRIRPPERPFGRAGTNGH